MASTHLSFSLLILVLTVKLSVACTDQTSRLRNPIASATSHDQFSHLNTFPVFFWLSRNSLFHRQQSANILVILVFLSGDIETNPGPSIQMNLCTLNVRSLFAADRSVFISDALTTNNIDIFAFTETYQNRTTTPVQLFDITPHGFQFFGQPRCCHNSSKANIGGGLGFLVRDLLSPDVLHLPAFTSFEAFAISTKSRGSKLILYNIYRPPDSSSYSRPFSTFMSEFSSFLSSAATAPDKFLITGDFNIHVNHPSDTHSSQFLTLLESFNLKQYVSVSTHISNNTLDLVIAPCSSNILSSVTVSPVSPSDHYMVMSSVNFQPPLPKPATLRTFRRTKSIDVENFCNDIASSVLISDPPTTLPELVNCYNTTLSRVLDKHAPVISKFIASEKSNPWYTTQLRVLKCDRRRCEHQWRAHPSSHTLSLLRKATKTYNNALLAAKKLYYSELVATNSGNSKRLWNTINNILHRHHSPSLPTSIPASSLAQSFAQFLVTK
jgi:exonuclease III